MPIPESIGIKGLRDIENIIEGRVSSFDVALLLKG